MASEAAADEVVPPLDELGIYQDLPLIPNATVRIDYEVRSTPRGTIRVELDLVDGQMSRAEAVEEFTPTDAPRVWVGIELDRHLLWRRGEATLLEALEGAEIEGRWQVLLLVHGLLQQPEWTDPLRALPRYDP